MKRRSARNRVMPFTAVEASLVRLRELCLEALAEREAPAPPPEPKPERRPAPAPAKTPRVYEPKVSPEGWAKGQAWWKEGVSTQQIAERLGVTNTLIYLYAKAHGWPKRDQRGAKASEVDWVRGRKLWEQGLPARQIAARLQCSSWMVLNQADLADWPKRARAVPPPPPLKKTVAADQWLCRVCANRASGATCKVCGHPRPAHLRAAS